LSPAYLTRILDRRHQSLEGTHDTIARVLAYPAVVLSASVIFFGLFAFLVAPVFRDVFDSLGVELPWLTSFVLRSAEWVTSIAWYWYLLIFLSVAAIVWRSVRSGRNYRDDRIAVVATFTESLAELLDAEVAIPEALRLAGRTAESSRFRNVVKQLAWQVESGNTAIQAADLPGSLIHAVTRIEEPTATASLLRELATIFRMTRNRRIHWVFSILEPLAIVGVGLIVGLVFFATFLPLFSLISNLS
jgi:type IV pilus assembly protein PilC